MIILLNRLISGYGQSLFSSQLLDKSGCSDIDVGPTVGSYDCDLEKNTLSDLAEREFDLSHKVRLLAVLILTIPEGVR